MAGGIGGSGTTRPLIFGSLTFILFLILILLLLGVPGF